MAILGLPLLLAPRSWSMPVIKLWARITLGALRLLCGVRVEVRGEPPEGPALIAAKHQSMLDTVAPLLVLRDPAYVLKRELLRLPFYGWYAAKMDMLPVDREGGSAALRAMVTGARARLADGRQLLIFPEGTRQPPGAAPDYKPGVAGLYRELGAPCVPLATNSGLHWPAHGWRRTPGVVVFEFLPAIPAGLKRASFMAVLEDTLEDASNRLMAADGFASPRPGAEES
ncbi:MAG: 1-acyl-sn-glycerol-3-phosphate acyltransferase [Caulobacteraceae bacterium]|nr:1-acyl-sn-glycerol-3-phosphate acyltransferase [Caulobacter sp.]